VRSLSIAGARGTPVPIEVMGVPVVPFESYEEALKCVELLVESGEKSFWVAINPIKIYHCWHQPELLAVLRDADVGFCDGIGVSIASRLLNGQSIKRVTGCDLFFRLISLASRKGWGVYMLGASAESNAAARSALHERHPELRIVGSQDGYFEDSQRVVEDINASGADLLFVAMGSPKQEYWIRRHRQDIAVSFCMGVGGSFDVASGRVRRAPKFFRATGTEFLFRIITEPRKRLPVYKALVPYFFRVIKARLFGFTVTAGAAKVE